jgi:hypothetical protein
MLFTPEEKMQLFNRLPALELSYEPKMHKKVYSPLYYIIPKGPKALLWYTYWGEENVCLLIMLNERGNYSDIKVFRSVFSDALALGTIIYGTHFTHQGKPYFTCQQLHYYKGVNVKNKEKISMLLEMFQKHIEQLAYTSDSLIVGLPVITEKWEEALEVLDTLPYKTYGIGAFISETTIRTTQRALPLKALEKPFKETIKAPIKALDNPFIRKGMFKVKAGLAADTYYLYNVSDDAYIGVAMVPTYKCSVMLNGLFRTIKENGNLDLLEESDDEDEFENTQLDKFVDLEKTILMECVFLKKFQKWQPMQKKI